MQRLDPPPVLPQRTAERNVVKLSLEVVKRALSGDQLAFQQLVHETWGLVFLTIRQRVRHREVAQDLSQDTFLKAFAKREALRDPKRFVPWLLQIARNAVIDHFRREEARPEQSLRAEWLEEGVEEHGGETGSQPQSWRGSSQSVASDQNLGEPEGQDAAGILGVSSSGFENSEIEKALSGVGDLYRTVLILKYWSGLSPAQIARTLGEPEGTIRNRIFRAHLKLREQIEKNDPEQGEESEAAPITSTTRFDRELPSKRGA